MNDYCVCAYFDYCPVHDVLKCDECGELYWKDKPHKHAGFVIARKSKSS
jgi:uncharacterized protein with PIN domain